MKSSKETLYLHVQFNEVPVDRYKLVQTLMLPTVYKLVNGSLLKSLLVTSVAKFNPLTLVFTFKYKVL